MVNKKLEPALHITKTFCRNWQSEKKLQGFKKDTAEDVEKEGRGNLEMSILPVVAPPAK